MSSTSAQRSSVTTCLNKSPSQQNLHHGDKLLIPNSYDGSRLVSEDSMKSAILILVVSLAALSTGCGSSSARMLESVTATPASADAQNFPNGTVQFTPTGIFNKAPTSVTPLPSCSAHGATGSCVTAWSTSPNTIATIDQNGLAQCVPGQSGTATIQVAVSGDGALMGVAKLTCP